MNGRPVWLASYSLRDRKGTVPAWTFNERQINRANAVLLDALAGVGDRKFERLFLMSLTACMHRGASAVEILALPWSMKDATCIAGGPAVRIVRETVVGGPSTRPCGNPRRVPLPNTANVQGRDLWLAKDCGKCLPCLRRVEAMG